MEWFQLQNERATLVSGRLNTLINQLNPHFLFNGLTVVYSLSLKDSRDTSSAVIKLSDILRYVIYGSAEKTVTVSSESAIIRDYIDLQRYRVHPSTQIDFIDQISSDLVVPPMLFLPLVENAFKHGVHNEISNAFVRITLHENSGTVTFTIKNSKSGASTPKGIGLKNLKERLELLYPNKHSLLITETEHEFNVEMHLHDRGR
jgi:LytS/YehU family sensor histidine kinase